MKKLEWFKFSPSDWAMGRISKMPMNIQGAYIRLCCIYWNKECHVKVKDAQLELLDNPQAYNTLVEFQVIKVANDQIIISFLDEQMQQIKAQSRLLSKAGKKGAKVKGRSTKAKGTLSLPQADKDKDKDKELDIYRSFEHLSITNKEYNKLCSEWDRHDVEFILDSIENYQHINKYKSLYLTARQWLRDKPKINSQGKTDDFAKNVLNQMGKKE